MVPALKRYDAWTTRELQALIPETAGSRHPLSFSTTFLIDRPPESFNNCLQRISFKDLYNRHTLETVFPPVERSDIKLWHDGESGWCVPGALLRTAAPHPFERAAGGEESSGRSSANSALPAAAAAAEGAGGGGGGEAICGEQRAAGRRRELPAGLHSRGSQHGQLHGAGEELGAVAVQVLLAEAGPGHEAALAEERLRDVQRRLASRVSGLLCLSV